VGKFLLAVVLALAGGCAHHLRYPVGDEETPRGSVGTPYVLAIADFADRRQRQPAETRSFEDGEYRCLPDSRLDSAGVELARALFAHLRFSGLFRKVVRAAPRARSHLLLAGEIRRLRVYGRPRQEGIGTRTHSDLLIGLSLWRVDGRHPVWIREFSLAMAGEHAGGLPEATNDAVRGAMNELVAQLSAALLPYRSGLPHPPQEP
jgi:hypothetical protein